LGKETSTSGYTGAQGSREQAYQLHKNTDGSLSFESTRLLRPNEGLTVAVSFPKGAVTQIPRTYFTGPAAKPVPKQKNYLLYIAVSLVLVYYLASWSYVGMDPDKGVIIPLYYPPKDFLPDAARYLSRMEYDHKAFTALILQLAVKGALKIQEDNTKIGPFNLGRTYTLVRTEAPKIALTVDEQKLLSDLLPFSGDTLELDNKNHTRFQKAIEGHKERLEVVVNRKLLYKNTGYYALGLLGSILLIFGAVSKVEYFRPLYLMISIAIILILNFVFYKLLKAPSKSGRGMLDKIEGFKMYLAATEKEALKWLDDPEKTPQLYEAYLPFAIALDVEDKWSRKFTEILTAAAAAGYAPSWYYSGGSFDAGSFGRNMDHGFSSAISASSHAPGSSSGSGGGGSSGGGGGGGGGGGW